MKYQSSAGIRSFQKLVRQLIKITKANMTIKTRQIVQFREGCLYHFYSCSFRLLLVKIYKLFCYAFANT